MLTQTEIENLLFDFIDLIELDGLSGLRNNFFNSPENLQLQSFSADEAKDTIWYTHVYHSEIDDQMHEEDIEDTFPDFIERILTAQKNILLKKITDTLCYNPPKYREEQISHISNRINKLITSAKSNELIEKYPIVIKTLQEITDYIKLGVINDLPSDERLCFKASRNKIILLFTLLKDAGLIYKHSDADIGKFLDARVSYYDDKSKSYKLINDAHKVISKFRCEDLNVEESLEELKNQINNTFLDVKKQK